MLQTLQKTYEQSNYPPANLAGGAADVARLDIVQSGTIKKVSAIVGAAVSGDVVFAVYLNGVAQPTAAITILSGSKVGQSAAISFTAAAGGEIVLRRVSGIITAPVSLVVSFDDGAGSGGDAGGLAWIPTDSADVALWLKSDSLSTSDGAAVASWADSSGNARDAAEATNKPTSYLSMLKNKTGVRFGSLGDEKLTTPSFSFKHLFILARYNAPNFNGLFAGYNGLASGVANSNANLIFTGNSGANFFYTPDWQFSPTYYLNGINGSSNYSAGTPTDKNAAFNVYEIYRTTAWTDGLIIGNDRNFSRGFGGDILEVAAFSAVLADSVRRNMYRYFNKNFGVNAVIP